MAADQYLRAVLTVIAAALVYLCIVLTPLPGAQAQQMPTTPGTPSGPAEVVLVGWQPGLPALPVEIGTPVRVHGPLEVQGTVQTRQSPGLADRVVLVGWEEGTTDTALGQFHALAPDRPGVPTSAPAGRQ
jgi:hypothetical protein